MLISGLSALLRFPISLAALLALVVGVSSTAMLYSAARHIEQTKLQAEFEQRAELRFKAVEAGLSEAIQGLQTINHLFAAVAPLSREEFHAFTAPLLKRYPYVQAYQFHRLVAAADLPAFEAAMRRQFPHFQVRQMQGAKLVPAADQPLYSIVDYLAPMVGNEAAFGLDVARNKHMEAVLVSAVESGFPRATGLLQLAQGGERRLGFLVMQPVYREGAPTDSIEARRRALIGDTAAVFRVTDLIAQMLPDKSPLDIALMDVQVFAGTAAQTEQEVFRRAYTEAIKNASMLPDWLMQNRVHPQVRHFDVAGTPWRMEISEAPRFIGADSSAMLILIAGALLTLLAAAYLQNVSTRSRAISQLVERRTAELKQANALLTDDLEARERADQALRLRERVIESSANAIMIIRAELPHFPIDYVNPALERISGYAAAELIGQHFRFMQTDRRDKLSVDEIKAALREQRETHVTLRSIRKDGSIFWNDIYIAPVRDRAGAVTHYVVTQYDVTSNKLYEAELEFQAHRDGLTGLANRNLLNDRLRHAIAYAQRYSHPIWVAFIDLDRFKVINESLGHKAGDLLLQQVAERLRGHIRLSETIARPGGDEFVLVLPQGATQPMTVVVVQRILDILAQPFKIEGHELFITASIGVATYPTDGLDGEALQKHAEIAMYRAKESGRNNFQFYRPQMNEEALERLRIEGNLRNAIERNEFVLHYQPQVDLKSGRIVGMEALIRWNHPELGMVPPARFISLAEETGLIVPIGAWVARTACLQAKAWQEAGLGELRIAINLSARQFFQRDLVQSIAAILEESGLAPEFLEIELTESMVMTDVDSAVMVLAALKALGIKIAIDDFGTGYSSLSYLKRFPIDVLKVDRSFVRDITSEVDDAAIVDSIISLAHNLRLQVIAEGVETLEQLVYLRDKGCDQVQGYYVSRPLPALAFAMMLQEGCALNLRAHGPVLFIE